MTAFPTEISFIVSPNDKGDNPKRPDWRGEVVIGAQKFKLAAWKRRKGGNGPEFISGKLTLEVPKGEEAPKEEPKHEPPASRGAHLDEDVPF